MKTCIKCQAEKLEHHFGLDKLRKDGLFPYCRQCRIISMKRAAYKYSILGKKSTDRRGYISRRLPNHPLADKKGTVREHRMVMYAEYGAGPKECADCGAVWNWEGGRNCHIDHIDANTSNNNISNLRFLCAPCNVFRGHTPTSMGTRFFTANNLTMTAGAWARRPDVFVAGNTIRIRRSRGYSDYDAIYAPRKTHQSTATKEPIARYDGVRGISTEPKEQTREDGMRY